MGSILPIEVAKEYMGRKVRQQVRLKAQGVVNYGQKSYKEGYRQNSRNHSLW